MTFNTAAYLRVTQHYDEIVQRNMHLNGQRKENIREWIRNGIARKYLLDLPNVTFYLPHT